MKPRVLVVVGTMASNPFAGMAWMTMQITGGLDRLGHEVYYFETTSAWPYDPVRQEKVCDSHYALPYLARITDSFGLGERWAYRHSYSDKSWAGPVADRAQALLAHADAVVNISGATRFADEDLEVGRLVYLGTDPVFHEIEYADGNKETISLIEEHQDCFTYGENIGTSECPLPALPLLRGTMRQPVLLDLWESGEPSSDRFTTVGNWSQEGREVIFAGEIYQWSKHHEFLKILDLPERVEQPIELAMNLALPESIQHGEGEPVRALGLGSAPRDLLLSRGWLLKDARRFTNDPWPYRDYIRESRGEITVARDLNVRLRSGWFSERSACYLAAGRPVITQDTGFGTALPTGEGLFAFSSTEEIVAAVEAINADYSRHSRAARSIAEEYFRAETIMARMLDQLGL